MFKKNVKIGYLVLGGGGRRKLGATRHARGRLEHIVRVSNQRGEVQEQPGRRRRSVERRRVRQRRGVAIRVSFSISFLFKYLFFPLFYFNYPL